VPGRRGERSSVLSREPFLASGTADAWESADRVSLQLIPVGTDTNVGIHVDADAAALCAAAGRKQVFARRQPIS